MRFFSMIAGYETPNAGPTDAKTGPLLAYTEGAAGGTFVRPASPWELDATRPRWARLFAPSMAKTGEVKG